ncbi:HpcH/HpaI aldolase/citrate lyase family protein [Micromonospora sp. DT31]|uniref:HpcH/HpaI aldolase/citrate lyase family protein n=1 Tax=Micromonospora sp. DT31 TaxID=3393434 RepID=UPI003CFB8497
MTRMPRSYLYAPGNEPRKLARAASADADAVICDLEDAVPPGAKSEARQAVAAFLADPSRRDGRWWVRINADSATTDITAVAGPALCGVVVPKAEPELLDEVAAALGRVESAGGLTPGSLRVLALLETARGILCLDRVARAPRVVRLGLGEADLAAELGLRPGPDKEELWPLRAGVVLHSTAAGLAPPVGPVETAVRDTDRLDRTTRLLLRQGFRARTLIHPAQAAVVNEVFTPSPQEVADARDLVARLADAAERGLGVAVAADGRMIDAAVARTAHDILARAV